MRQLSSSDIAHGGKCTQTRREAFLSEMQRSVPWPRLEALIGRTTRKPAVGGGRIRWQ